MTTSFYVVAATQSVPGHISKMLLPTVHSGPTLSVQFERVDRGVSSGRT